MKQLWKSAGLCLIVVSLTVLMTTSVVYAQEVGEEEELQMAAGPVTSSPIFWGAIVALVVALVGVYLWRREYP